MATAKINISQSNWTGLYSAVFLDTSSHKLYTSTELTEELTRLPIPVRDLYRFDGYYNSSSGSTMYVDADGLPTEALLNRTGGTTIYVQGTKVSVRVTLDDNGGSGGIGEFFKKLTVESGESYYYSDYLCEHAISSVTIPIRAGHTFGGYYNGTTTPGTQYVGGDGTIGEGLQSITANKIIHASWTANTYRLYFNYDGGSVGIESKEVIFGQRIGELPTSTKAKASFDGWRLNGVGINSQTVYDIAGDATAAAVWSYNLGRVYDYFSLATDNLIPISSDAGDDVRRVCVTNATGSGSSQANAGRYSSGVDHTGGVWRNPSVTYRVVGDMTLSVALGRAFASLASGVSGYFIVAVEIRTTIGEFPLVTVTGSANEGADAINLFSVSVPIVAAAHPQNLLSCSSGGGEMQSCSILAAADPVVCEENLMPCASDVVRGRITATVETVAVNGDSAPVAGGGFAAVGSPVRGTEGAFPTYVLTAVKEIV